MTFTDALVAPDGWSYAGDRKPGRFKFCCCDCGLVHVHDLSIVRLTGHMSEAGRPLVETVEDPALRISVRIRRDEEASDNERRRHHYEFQP